MTWAPARDVPGAGERAGYADLVAWARTLGDLEAFGIEGTGSSDSGFRAEVSIF